MGAVEQFGHAFGGQVDVTAYVIRQVMHPVGDRDLVQMHTHEVMVDRQLLLEGRRGMLRGPARLVIEDHEACRLSVDPVEDAEEGMFPIRGCQASFQQDRGRGLATPARVVAVEQVAGLSECFGGGGRGGEARAGPRGLEVLPGRGRIDGCGAAAEVQLVERPVQVGPEGRARAGRRADAQHVAVAVLRPARLEDGEAGGGVGPLARHFGEFFLQYNE